MYLAIDTSTDTAGLAIICDGIILSQESWCCRQNHSVELLPRLARMLQALQLEAKDLRGIIAARGPGSFNGLRVGLGTAKGLAFSLGIPIAGISTLEAEAYRYASSCLPICALINAGRSEVACAVYRMKDGKWSLMLPENINTIEGVCAETHEPTLFCGEPTTAISSQLKQCLGDKAVIPGIAASERIVSLAMLGEKKFMSNDIENTVSLQPIYLRRPSITQPKSKNNCNPPHQA
jgi:tRNA threonylcarbamoyl adenosine modification protein YeaZ